MSAICSIFQLETFAVVFQDLLHESIDFLRDAHDVEPYTVDINDTANTAPRHKITMIDYSSGQETPFAGYPGLTQVVHIPLV